MFGAERAVKVNLNKAGLLAFGVQAVNGLFHGARNAAHCNNDAVGVGCAIVVEQMILTACQGAYLLKIILNNLRKRVVVRVAGFAHLEEDVGVLHRSAHKRVLRIERVRAEGLQCVAVEHIGKSLCVNHFHSVNLVRRAESVEEVHKRCLPLDGGQVSHSGKVDNLLNAASAEHCETGVAAAHYVGMVAEDAHCVRSHRACGHVQNHRQTLARNAVQHRNH